MSLISTEDLFKQLGEPGVLLLDIRGTAAYNGWRLEGEARGGHIPGAVNLPVAWLKRASEMDSGALLESKGIHPGKPIVVYGGDENDRGTMVRALGDMGCREVRIYQAGMAAWTADDALPMARLANFEKLVHPQWLFDVLHGLRPATVLGRGFRLFEVGSDQHAAYGQGHIPGAAFFDTNSIEAEPLWNHVSDQDLEAALLARGVSHDTTVVLYGKDTLAAARVASILMFAGVEDVRLLDGGFQAWTSAGYAIEAKANVPPPARAFGRQIPACPDYIVDREGARAILADPDAELVSVRSWAEYTGETSGYDYIEAKGRIAGALWGGSGRAPHSLEGLRNADGTMRSYPEIEADWRAWGITPDKKISFYCGTGWRASEAFFYAYLMGWERISVYDGGWNDWSSNPSNPVESGEPETSKSGNP